MPPSQSERFSLKFPLIWQFLNGLDYISLIKHTSIPQMRPFGSVATANFAVYGWKSAGYVVLIFSFISCWKFPKANCFRVYRQLTTWPTIAKGLLTLDYLFRKLTVSEKSKSIFHKLIFNLVRPISAHQKLLPIHESVYSLKSIVRVP